MDSKRIEELTEDAIDKNPVKEEVLPPMTLEELDTFLTEEDKRAQIDGST